MKLSVALCTYNGSKYIQEQIQSIIDQTVPPDEIIVCDDQSTDDTVDIVQSLQQQHSSIFLFVNHKNIGAKKNFEKAIELTTGDIIFLSDQDDIWMPDKIEVFVREFERQPQVKAMFSDGFLLYGQEVSQDKSLWESVGFNEAEMMKEDHYWLFNYINYFDNVVTGAALAFRKEAKEVILPFRMSKEDLHDYWICNALAQQGTIVPISQKTFAYRIHPGQQVGIVNVQYIDYLNKLKRKLIYNEESLNANEEFNILWSAFHRYKKLASLFGADSEGVSCFKEDLKHKRSNFYNRLGMYDRAYYKSRWALKNMDLHFS